MIDYSELAKKALKAADALPELMEAVKNHKESMTPEQRKEAEKCEKQYDVIKEAKEKIKGFNSPI